MTNNKKAAWAGTRTASYTAFSKHNHTAFDAILGRLDRMKPSRSRQQKRLWQKGAP